MSDRFDFLELDNNPLRSAPRQAAAKTEIEAYAPRVEPATWKVVELIGGPGSGAGQFASPTGLAVDRDGNLYVADSYHHRIQRITPRGDVYLLGRRGTGPGEFLNPQAIVADGGSGYYVLEQGGCRIQHFGTHGEWLGEFGSPGKGRGQMSAPMAMARDPFGCLFVADSGNNRIVKWSPDGLFLDQFPSVTATASFRPQGLAVDRAGRIWVAETPRHRLVVFDSLFRVLGTRGGPGDELGQFREPKGLAVTPGGGVLVADTGNNRVQVWDAEGAPRQAIRGDENAGSKVGAFSAPSGLATRGEDEAYVADTGNHRILRLSRS
jgi:DNA-binding beta-propeller fold protein YncE